MTSSMTLPRGGFVPLVKFGEKTIHFPDGMAPDEIQGVLDKDKRRAEDMARMLGRPEYYPEGGNPLEGFKSALLATPIVGDIAGLVMDAEMYANEPESRNWFNYLFSAAGILPLIPNPAQFKQAAQKIKAYHGTMSKNPIDKFRASQDGMLGKGVYVSENPDFAGNYAGMKRYEEGGSIYPVEFEGRIWDVDEMGGKMPRDVYTGTNDDIVAGLQGDGYSAVKWGEEIAVLNPDDLKSTLRQKIKGFHGSPHDFPPVRELEMPDGAVVYQSMGDAVPDGARVIKEHPLGRF